MGRIPKLLFKAIALLGWAPAFAAPGDTRVDIEPRKIPRIAPGTLIGANAPKGWSHLVLLAEPRLAMGDIKAVPESTAHYASMFSFVVLAHVRPSANETSQRYVLERVAIGTAVRVQGRTVVVSNDHTFGKDFGLIGLAVLQEHEAALDREFRQVARTPTMLVFDANAIVLYNRKHSRLILRHAIVVSPRDGTLTSFVWLLGSDSKGGYSLAEPSLQRLPSGAREDRALSVDAGKFTLGIPANDAFALARIPQGTPAAITPALRSFVTRKRFEPESALRLEAALHALIAAPHS
jgi:hypothetical protein